MSLADDLHEAEQAAIRKQPCKTGVWLESLDDRDRDAIRAFLAAGKPVSHLHGIAVRNGCGAAETRFRSHFRKRCACFDLEHVA
ncbi:hypothetical protein ACFRAQ_35805 [Nocardia sp. NPDC056611]|uniref:hypothetical protein n=1 Tax=Nocardia sp. NPDC056611 TaxID=3345877 RepID=UPI0036709EE1